MKKLGLIFLAATVLGSCHTAAHITNVHTEKNSYVTADIAEDAGMNAVIAPYKAELEKQMNVKISYTSADLTKSGDNSVLGNLLADYTLQGAQNWARANEITDVDAAVINIGGIRTIIPKGDIYTKSIYEVMPFENELVIVKMTGAQVQNLFEYYRKTRKNNPVAGLYIETDSDQLVNATIGGKKVDPAKIYYIATSDYLAMGGDTMNFFSQGNIINTGIKLRDLYLQKFKDNPDIRPSEPEVRLRFKNNRVGNE